MTNAEKFAKLNGIHWHEWRIAGTYDGDIFYYCKCGQQSGHELEITFSDAKSILEVMQKRDDFGDFLHTKVGHITTPTRNEQYAYVEIYYVYNPDKLLDEAIKFCKENKV